LQALLILCQPLWRVKAQGAFLFEPKGSKGASPGLFGAGIVKPQYLQLKKILF
jgi:hypothetical protein